MGNRGAVQHCLSRATPTTLGGRAPSLSRFMPTGGPTRGLAHIPALDGLRGLAVAGVLAFHGGFEWAAGGFLGVSTFFTLSGFLITSLLLLERESTGHLDLLRFWSRRLRRLLPAALLCLLGVAVYGLLVAKGHQAERLSGDALSALGYVANWRFVIGDHSYAALFSDPSPVQHFWSLAIEEQFYLFYPLVAAGALALVGGSRHRYAILLGTLAVASSALMWVLHTPGTDPSRVYYGTDTRAAELLIGALLAAFVAGRPGPRSVGARRALATAGTLALGALVTAWLALDQADVLLYRGGLPVHALLCAVVIAAVMQRGPATRVLSLRPLCALGLVSYGAYLYHWPIFLWLSPDRTGLDGAALFAVRIATTLAVAVLSYHFVELPIRRGRRVTGWQPALLAPLGAAAVAVAFVATPMGTDAPRIVFSAVNKPSAAFTATETAGTVTTTTSVPTSGASDASGVLPLTNPPDAPAPPPVGRIMIVGDSVAQTLGRGLERWGPPHGVGVLNAATYWCPVARGGRLANQFGSEQSEGCKSWATDWGRHLQRFDPDVVVVLVTVWDIGPRERNEWGPGYREPGDPVFDQWLVSDWQAAYDVLASRGARVVWLVPPCASDPSLSNALRRDYGRLLPRLQATRPVIFVDLRAYACPDAVFTDVIDGVYGARPDGLHFSDPGADAVAAWLGPRIVDPGLQSDLESTRRVRRI